MIKYHVQYVQRTCVSAISISGYLYFSFGSFKKGCKNAKFGPNMINVLPKLMVCANFCQEDLIFFFPDFLRDTLCHLFMTKKKQKKKKYQTIISDFVENVQAIF